MAFDFSSILKLVPEATISNLIDETVDAELVKAGTALKALVKTELDKAYGTSVATAAPAAPPLTTSAQK
jgi:hypothetical protein